jgi:plasmid stabilization system protein ParE
MGKHQLSPEAEAELDGIWHYIASQSGSLEIAHRLIESITDRFWRLVLNLIWGVSAIRICAPGFAASRSANM